MFKTLNSFGSQMVNGYKYSDLIISAYPWSTLPLSLYKAMKSYLCTISGCLGDLIHYLRYSGDIVN